MALSKISSEDKKLISVAEKKYSKGDWDEAVKDLNNILKKKKIPEALILRGEIKNQMYDYEGSKNDCEAYIELMLDLAIENSKILEDENDMLGYAHAVIAAYYAENCRWNENNTAKRIMNTLASKELAFNHNYMAHFYYKNEDAGELLNELNEDILSLREDLKKYTKTEIKKKSTKKSAVKPKNEQNWHDKFNLGKDLYKKGNYKKAIEVYNESIPNFPASLFLYQGRVLCFEKLITSIDYVKLAIQDYIKILELIDQPLLLKWTILAHERLGQLYFSMGKKKEAKQHLIISRDKFYSVDARRMLNANFK